ncbi:probable NADH dehydrogenase [ubiquinone] 1 beta subcomplex subunit 2, mitochondrial [Contarinia nasturtii]|uniref:probable NADH dehydrogenase [ubiquinone] 1 beta subcomplex subunit 2, mitochondrial n=1 Tax=Contarinia nasturtii TaxID=265458 RepID=UPI0012D3A11F|nr:probable NADH dehydrogenase [ubiquinone] 1 beta subcomplex subunit 2, mitochondrial [Contarinia nasturtii]
MLAARVLSRAVAQAATNGKLLGAVKNKKPVRLMPIRFSGDWTYRTGHIHHPLYKRAMVQFAGGFMWWWILWHLYWDWGHIVGEFEYPDTSKWTDEELGIPPDDEE